MDGKELRTDAAIAILTMAEIEAATDGFNSGETNVYEALDAIAVALEAHQSAARCPRRKAA